MNIKSGKWAKKECLGCGKITTNIKFCSGKCQQNYLWEGRKKQIKKIGMVLKRRAGIRYLRDVEGNICKICGLISWNGKDITMIMDHIDGNSENNCLLNLRLICPNCDSQLSTYKSRNRGNGRYFRRERYAKGKSF